MEDVFDEKDEDKVNDLDSDEPDDKHQDAQEVLNKSTFLRESSAAGEEASSGADTKLEPFPRDQQIK